MFPPSLCVFARRPESGRVKTRLAAEIGAEAALGAYRDCLRAVAAQAARIAPRGSLRGLFVFGTPDGCVNDMAAWFPRWSAFMDQGDGDLGERMGRAFRRCSPAVLIGTDSPDLPDAHVEQAFRDLESHDVVLGPAEDGGYVLIGLREQRPDLFRDIPWSTPAVLETTLKRAAGLRVSLLPPWYDIDTRADLERWRRGTAGAQG
ncbi:MAG: TIGR04282 family arsenosugar biosynthesis glycosyltransferase [Candidatus Brocadiae bacterium]|nr:TIGR04282 family arsenosugar biosynthesis glycosyltransferase [Candidatus Brocadiia bacterium]